MEKKHDIWGPNYSFFNKNLKQKDCIFHFHFKTQEDFNNKVKACRTNGGRRDDGQPYHSLIKPPGRGSLHECPWLNYKLPHNDYYLLLNFSIKLKEFLKKNES